VNVLDSKRSLNVNIILHQFHVTPTDLVQALRSALPRSARLTPGMPCSHLENDPPLVELSVERLRGLERVLPEADDIDALRAFDGDPSRLGNAEQFYLQLITLPQYVDLYVHVCSYRPVKTLQPLRCKQRR